MIYQETVQDDGSMEIKITKKGKTCYVNASDQRKNDRK